MNALPPPPSAPASKPGASALPVFDVRQLFGSEREIVLMHQGEAYHLRITARERLILTK